MDEKPINETTNGFKKLSSDSLSRMSDAQRLDLLKKKKRAYLLRQAIKKSQGPVLSDEAAAIMAKALKGMLNSPQ